MVHLQNYLKVSVPQHLQHLSFWAFNLRHTWSLAVEEHFYLALPPCVALLGRVRGATSRVVMPALTLLVSTSCLVLRAAVVHAEPTVRLPLEATHLRIDSLFLGVLLAYFQHFRGEKFLSLTRRPALLTACGVLLLWPAHGIHGVAFAGTIGYTLLALAFAAVLLGVLRGTAISPAFARFFASPPARAVAFVGFYSYSIYLWHLSVGVFLANAFIRRGLLAGYVELRWLVATAIYVSSAVVVGVVLGKLIEYPALAVRDRLFPSATVLMRAPETEAGVAVSAPLKALDTDVVER
jgi:peptidoglycan/LPS O-acetylase OafA/YrhL